MCYNNNSILIYCAFGHKAIRKDCIKLAQVFDFKNDYTGLEPAQAEENLDLYGYNSDTKLDEKTKGYNPLKAFINLRMVLMASAAGVSIWYGYASEEGVWSIFAGFVLIMLCVIYGATELKKNTDSDKYFFELKKRSKTEFRIIRGGEFKTIRRELIVPDDIMVLSAGESVPADAHLLEIRDLTVDESVFTADKTPVKKITGADSTSENLKRSCIYKGTKIVSGELVARVTGTGVDTKYFKQYGAVKETDEYYTSLEKTVMRISDIFTAAAAVMLVIGVVTYIDIRADLPIAQMIYGAFYPSAAFALCFIPSETASLLRLYYAKGSQLLEEKNIWVKNLSTVEYINAVTCILIDKSGMVTKNNMQVADELTGNPAMLSNISVLSCMKDTEDPFDKAIILNASFNGNDTSELMENELIKSYPFDDTEGCSGNVWIVGGARLMCIKGTPDKLLPMCDVPVDMLYTVQNKQLSYARQGCNVLAVAFAKLDDDAELPERITDGHYSFMGLIAFENQTKDYIPAAILNCQKAGIRVIMTTGDSAEAGLAVARKIGIKGDTVVTGDMLMSGEELDFSDVGVFARITSEMKPELIRRLQKSGEVVMITGESASDSDLLELADIGVSIAKDVTGAAFEECDVVVGNDSFETVTEILSTARQSHLNIKRCICASLTALITLVVFAVFDLFVGTGFVVSPVLGGMLTVLAVPAASLMFCEHTADMKNSTRPSMYIGRGKLRKSFFLRPLLQGLGLAASEIIYYLISSGIGNNDEETVAKLLPLSQSGFLLIFIFGLLLTCWANLSERNIIDGFRSGQTLSWLITGIMVGVSLIIVFVPYLNSFFGFGAPDILSAAIALVITVVLQIPAEIMRATFGK